MVSSYAYIGLDVLDIHTYTNTNIHKYVSSAISHNSGYRLGIGNLGIVSHSTQEQMKRGALSACSAQANLDQAMASIKWNLIYATE